METIEQQAIATAPNKPSHWFRFIDDTLLYGPREKRNYRIFYTT
jgi:hypothetical protein